MHKSQVLYGRGYRPMRYPQEYKKNFFSRKKAIILLWVLFLILIFAYILFLSPVFRVKDIKISDNRVISSEEINDSLNNFLSKEFLFFFNRNNIFLAADNKLKNILFGDFPRIASIEIDKDIFKKTIELRIIERKEAGIFCRKDCYYIDENGAIFEEAPQTSGTLILAIKDNSEGEIEIGKNAIDKAFMAELINLKNDLLNQFGLKVLDFIIETDVLKDLRANTNEGWYILFDRERDLKNQLQALKLVLEGKIKDGRKNLEYVDLRIENRVYYK